MKFWKLKMNDRNYLLVSVRREHMRDVTLCSEQMQQEGYLQYPDAGAGMPHEMLSQSGDS